MDQVYRRQRYIYDLTRKYYLFGRDRMIRELDLQPGARLVEIGCGTARNLVKIAKVYPQARLFGLDASGEMLKSANAAVARAGLSDRILLAHGYAEALSPEMFGEQEPFDVALFSYSLSMIPDWKGALSAAARALSPEGTIRAVDFADLKGLGRGGESLLRFWLSLFHVSPREELIRSFEKVSPGGNCRVHVLPGRYAFLIALKKQALEPILKAVAS